MAGADTKSGSRSRSPTGEAVRDEARHILGEHGPTEPEAIHARCRKDIATILRASKKHHEEKQTEKENNFYDSNRKLYHKSLKVEAGLLPKAGTLPNLDTVRTDSGPSKDPKTVIETVAAFFTKELERVTPDTLPPSLGGPGGT